MAGSDKFIPFKRNNFTESELIQKSADHYQKMDQRRSIREFSNQPVPREVIENLIKTASSAPSGAHKQPWTFCAISNPELKKKIRAAAEEEEYTNYNGRMSEDWLKDLAVFQTDWHKEFLEIAPWLIVLFRQNFGYENGEKVKHYYVQESVGIAAGFLISAIHQAGLVTLTHTPSPMNFLTKILERPDNEKPFLLLPVGYAAADCKVPDLNRKRLDEMTVFYS